MKTVITDEQLKVWQDTNESVKGTFEYMRHYAMTEAKTSKKWGFIGWGVPRKTGYIKKS